MKFLIKFKHFAKKMVGATGGWYERTYTDFESDWYELKTEGFKENTVLDKLPVETQSGKKLYLEVISAYHELNISPKGFREICVPDEFRKVCIDIGAIPGAFILNILKKMVKGVKIYLRRGFYGT